MFLLKCRSIDDLSSAVCLSVSCKTVGRWVGSICCFMKDTLRRPDSRLLKKTQKMETLEGQFCLTVHCQRQTNLKPEQAKGLQVSQLRGWWLRSSAMTPSHWAVSYRAFEETQEVYRSEKAEWFLRNVESRLYGNAAPCPMRPAWFFIRGSAL